MKKLDCNAKTVTIEETYAAMSEIAYGQGKPSVKLAFWSSALSCRMKLHLNGQYVRILAKYVSQPLPDRETLLNELGRRPGNQYPAGMMGYHVDLIYRIEELDNAGLLNCDSGLDLASQQAWRDTMVELVKGMGSKLISWALFIYSPFDCKLLTIDCWHCQRMGIDQFKIAGSSKCKQAEYKRVEAAMLAECQALYPTMPPVVVAAMLWQNIRLAYNASNEAGYESHKAISCRWY